MTFLRPILFATAVVLSAGAANAASVLNTSNSMTTDGCSLDNFRTSIACNGNLSVENPGGNVAASDLNGVFKDADGVIDDWMYVDRIASVDQDNTSTSQAGAENFFEVMLTSETEGMWRLIEPAMFDPAYYYAFAIKGSTDQAVYVMDTASMSGDWTTFDLFTNNNENNPGLSNIGLYKAPATVIPLPAAGWLLIAGLGGLAVMRRRKS